MSEFKFQYPPPKLRRWFRVVAAVLAVATIGLLLTDHEVLAVVAGIGAVLLAIEVEMEGER